MNTSHPTPLIIPIRPVDYNNSTPCCNAVESLLWLLVTSWYQRRFFEDVIQSPGTLRGV